MESENGSLEPKERSHEKGPGLSSYSESDSVPVPPDHSTTTTPPDLTDPKESYMKPAFESRRHRFSTWQD